MSTLPLVFFDLFIVFVASVLLNPVWFMSAVVVVMSMFDMLGSCW